jgi:hypothetical protein
MAAYPLQTFTGRDIPLFIPNDGSISVSTINASTITAEQVEISNGSNAGWGVVPTGVSSIAETMIVQTNGNLLHIDTKTNVNASTLQTFVQGFPANAGNYIETYSTQDLAGNSTTRGSIQFVSSLTGAGGGIELNGQDSTYFRVGDQGTDIGLSNARLNTFINPPNAASIRHYTPDGWSSAIDFLGGAGNFSSITLTTANNSNQVAVGAGGIDLTPGTGNDVLLTNGFFNMNGLGMSNVSSINGAEQQPVTYIDPYGASPIFSTIGSSSVAIPMIPFSTIAGKTYQVSVEYSATNGGGGGANDVTMLGISNSNSSTGLYGRFIAVDTWVTLQTYDAYRANVTAIFPCNSNNSGQSVLQLLDVSAVGNEQIVTVEQFTVKDLGFPVNVF